MNRFLRIFTVGALALTLAACSTTAVKPAVCIVAGALVGGGAAAAADDEAEAVIAASAMGGMLIGSLLCKDPPPPEPKPAPAPKPEPKPAPPPPPPPDTDGDGVLDRDDDCPGTPKGVRVDARGCAEIPNLTGVHFEHDKAVLTAPAKSMLDEAVAILKRDQYVRVEIVGHTDASGTEAYNQRLSERRAAAVEAYLESHGIDASRLTSSGRGESAPIASNDTKAGRAENRRVELTARPVE